MYRLIHPSNVENYWGVAAPWLAGAISDDQEAWYDLDVIKEQCKNGSSSLWIGWNPKQEIDVVLVTETWSFAGQKTLVLRWLGGKNMDQWLEDYSVLEAYAEQNGFTQVMIWGRKGFEKVCKPLGFIHQFTVLSKPILRGLH